MPISEDQADRTIHAFYNEFRGISGVRILHEPTQEHFYGPKASVEALGFEIKGAFLPARGQIHLALANFHNEGDLRKSLQHEALGHFGSLTFTGAEKRELLEVISAARESPSMREDWAKVDTAYDGQSELMKAEEVFCLAAERIDGPSRNTDDQVARVWSDVVTNKVRPLERDDLQTIVESVADGLRRGTRVQQIFPIDDRSQFSKTTGLSEVAIDRAQPGPPNAKSLTDDQVRAIALDYYSKRAAKTEAQAVPRMVLVGGQPGAGKSQASMLAKAELSGQGGYIHIDADRMRERIPLAGAKPSSEQTQADAGRLVSALRELAVANRRNIMEEGTYRNAEGAERFVAGKQEQGYKVEMLAVATPPEQSLLGIYHRHELQHQAKADNPRLVPEKYHEDAVQGFEATLVKASAVLDRTRVIDRGGKVLFDSLASQRGNVLEALTEGRKLTDVKLREASSVWAETREMAARRQAPVSYQETLKAHHERIESMQKERIHGHAMNRLDTHMAALARDARYDRHTGGELAKAAYFRGFHEKASEFKGTAPDFAKYDTTVASRQALRQFPDVRELEGQTVQRSQQRTKDAQSL